MNKSREESRAHRDHRETSANLDRQYNKIGIPAVAAAVRYHGEPKSETRRDRHAPVLVSMPRED